jgi:hypothetical protein
LELRGFVEAKTEPTKDTLGRASLIGLRETRFWGVLMIAVAFWANILRGDSSNGIITFDTLITNVLDNGAFDLLAWTLIFVNARRMTDRAPSSPRQIAWTYLLGLIVIVPVRIASGVALSMLSYMLICDPRATRAGRQIGTIMFALALETFWTSPFLTQLHIFVGRLDAHICAMLLRLFGISAIAHGNVVENQSSEFSIMIWPFCASSMPLAGVTLAFLVIVFYRNKVMQIQHLVWLFLSFVASIILTESRLVLMARNQDDFEWWHFGPGLSIYALCALGFAVLFPLWATSGTSEANDQDANRRLP